MVDSHNDLPIPHFDNPERYVADIVKLSGSSFSLPMLILPKSKRQAMLALYAFCRETDDVADEIDDDELSKRLINAWRQEIKSLFNGFPLHPVTKALAEPIKKFGLTQKPFLEILDGFEMDRSGMMVRPCLKDLELYCHRVASCVGLISVRIFGYSSPETLSFAEHLGQAFQLTNILRDIEEDASRGRIYLPIELLEKEGIDSVPAEELMMAPGLDKVCRNLGLIARERFRLADNSLPDSEKKNMRPAILMRSVYEAYLDEIERREFQVSKKPLRFSKLKKLSLLCRGLVS
ncbi:MAG: squalene synthase HpnD [Gammaproteobacteria bacterium]|nr:squalene synthase HpnD [Gammaproteobacteria bacterium]